MERRFDNVERELLKDTRLQNIEKDLSRLRESTTSLANDLKSFSFDMSSRFKDSAPSNQ
jgi:hypothetical protein